MKLSKHYSNKIALTNWSSQFNSLAFIHINENTSKQLLKDVNVLEFNNLYPRIIVGLYDENKLDGPLYSYEVERIRSFIRYKDSLYYPLEHHVAEQTFCNSFFGILVRDNRHLVDRVLSYARIVWDDLINNNNQDDIIYIDSDMIFYRNDINLCQVNTKDFPITMKKYDYVWMERKKNYVYLQNGIISSKGFYSQSGKQERNIKEIELLFKSEQRNNIIDECLKNINSD